MNREQRRHPVNSFLAILPVSKKKIFDKKRSKKIYNANVAKKIYKRKA